jgi:hypothetical protein
VPVTYSAKSGETTLTSTITYTVGPKGTTG